MPILRHLLFSLLACLFATTAAIGTVAHPQDGPHADLRISIEDTGVRFSIGVNLALLDEALDVSREALNAITPEEEAALMEAYEAYLRERVPCRIDGEPVEATIEALELFANPDPGMVAIFPRMGVRAVIRSVAVLNFPAETPPDVVEISWPIYPVDTLAAELEGAEVQPSMFFEVLLIAQGKTLPVVFSEPQPTITWRREGASVASPMDDLPRPAVVVATAPGLSAVPIGLGALGLAGLVIGSVAGRWPAQRRITFVGAGVVLSVLAFAFSQVGVAPASQPVLSSQQAGAVVEVLHTNLYRAFDYTADSDVYDRLALSVDGDLLSTLYEQIKLSLLQAEEDMKVGVVTGLDHESTEVTAIDSAGDHGLGGFDATLRWRVDGTVYHWGHSHTRVHEYEAAYRVDWLEDGWRITGQQLLSQERIDPGATADRLDPLQQMLQQLGTPDI